MYLVTPVTGTAKWRSHLSMLTQGRVIATLVKFFDKLSHPGQRLFQKSALRDFCDCFLTPYLGSIYAVALSIVAGDTLGSLGYRLFGSHATVILVAVSVLLFLFGRKLLGLLVVLTCITAVTSCAAFALLIQKNDGICLQRYPDGSQVRLQGQLSREPERANGNLRFFVDVDRIGFDEKAWNACRATVRVTLLDTAWFRPGQRIELSGRLRFPRDYGNPGEFSYEAYLARQGVAGTVLVRSANDIRVIGGGYEYRLSAAISEVRRRIGRFIDSNLPYPQREEMRAVIIGDRGGIGREIQETFGVTGMTHLLVISGLHMGFVAGFTFLLVRFLLSFWPRLLILGQGNKLAAIAAAMAVIGYSLLAGHHVSTLRAMIMVLCYAFAIVFDRSHRPLAALLLAAAVIIFIYPGSTSDIGFQMSFASVLAIVLGMRQYSAWWRNYQETHLLHLRPNWTLYRLASWFGAYIALSLYVTIGVGPLTAYHFNQISLVSPLANAVVVPIMGLVGTVGGLIATVLSFFMPGLAAVLLKAAGDFLSLGAYLAHWFANLRYAWVRCFTPTLLEMAIAYGAIILWLTHNRANLAQAQNRQISPPVGRSSTDFANRFTVLARRIGWVFLLVTLSVDASWWIYDRLFNPALRVAFLSVGEGDATVVRFPGSRVMLIDGGGSLNALFDPGERLVARYLWSQKIMTLDYLVLTHPDVDHYGGLAFVADNFHPKNFWTIQAGSSARRYLLFLVSLAARSNTRLRLLNEFSPITEIGGVKIRCLNPPGDGLLFKRNDMSLVLLMSFGDYRILFTGDIEAPAEAKLVSRYGQRLVSSVLKVPHHGSNTSSSWSFIATSRPKVAVISAGHLNQYRFPAQSVLERYKENNVKVFRTDEDGAILLQILPHSLKLKTWRSRVEMLL